MGMSVFGHTFFGHEVLNATSADHDLSIGHEKLIIVSYLFADLDLL